MKDEKYPDAVIICPASNVDEDEFQSKKSLPAKTFDRETLFTFHFLLFTIHPSSFIIHPCISRSATSRPHPSPKR